MRLLTDFKKFKKVFDEIDRVEIGQDLKFPKCEDEGFDESDLIPRGIFAPSQIGLTEDKRYGGIENQKNYFEEFAKKNESWIEWKCAEEQDKSKRIERISNFVKNLLSIIGGFRFQEGGGLL